MSFKYAGEKYIIADKSAPHMLHRLDASTCYFSINKLLIGGVRWEPGFPIPVHSVENCDHFVVRCKEPDKWVKIPKDLGNLLIENNCLNLD